jgi:hypothetical protein
MVKLGVIYIQNRSALGFFSSIMETYKEQFDSFLMLLRLSMLGSGVYWTPENREAGSMRLPISMTLDLSRDSPMSGSIWSEMGTSGAA